MNAGVIAGATIAGVAILLVLGFLIWFFVFHRKKNTFEPKPYENNTFQLPTHQSPHPWQQPQAIQPHEMDTTRMLRPYEMDATQALRQYEMDTAQALRRYEMATTFDMKHQPIKDIYASELSVEMQGPR
jgi:hypothetical protein